MKKSLFLFVAAYLTVLSSLHGEDNNSSMSTPLTDKQMDSIFISFVKEREEERKRVEEEKEGKKKAKEKREREIAEIKAEEKLSQPGGNTNRRVYPRDVNNPRAYGEKGQLLSSTKEDINTPQKIVALDSTEVNKEESNLTQEPKVIIPVAFIINGIMCHKGDCSAFTSIGVLQTGDSLSTDENVTSVTSGYIETNKQKIIF